MPVTGSTEAQAFIELHYCLDDGVTAERARAVFGAIADLRPTGPSRWLWLEEPPADSAPATPAIDALPVLGMITLDDRRLDVLLRSGRCTARVQAVLAPVLLALAGPPLQLGIVRRPPPHDRPAPLCSTPAAPVRVEPVLMQGDYRSDRSPADGDRMVACLVIDRQETSPESRSRTGESLSHWLWSIPAPSCAVAESPPSEPPPSACARPGHPC